MLEMGQRVDSHLTLSQPPPDQPPPSQPSAQAIDSRVKAKRIWWLGGLSFAFCLIVFGLPLAHRSLSHPDRTRAFHNIREVGFLLLQFDRKYRRYPDARTIAAVQAETKTTLSLGSSSPNQLFRQLLASCPSIDERPFWVRTSISPKGTDNVFTSDATALAPGECGFAYVAGLNSSVDPETPVLLTPLIPGTHEFDPKPFGGKAVILYNDNIPRSHTIDKHGHVIINGKDIFDPKQPFWYGKAPDIKWPE